MKGVGEVVIIPYDMDCQHYSFSHCLMFHYLGIVPSFLHELPSIVSMIVGAETTTQIRIEYLDLSCRWLVYFHPWVLLSGSSLSFL